MNVRKNVLIVLALLVLCGGLFLLGALHPQTAGGTVLITVDGKEYARFPLGKRQEITIEPEEGEFNTLVIDDEGVEMISSSCRDQLCVRQGKVTAQNAAERALGCDIICLPHRVMVSLTDVDLPETADLPDA